MSLAPQPVNASFELAGLPDPSAPPSLTGWFVADGELAQDTARARTSPGVSGRWSAMRRDGFQATVPAVPDFGLGRLVGSFPEGEPLEPWGIYTLTAWMLTSVIGVSAALRFGYVPNGVPADAVTSATTPLVAGAWTAVRVAWTPLRPYDGPQVQVAPFLPVPGAATALWLDDFAVTVAGR